MSLFRVKNTGRVLLSVLPPLLSFRRYWDSFDGGYTAIDMFLGAVVTLALIIAIYLYFPLAKKFGRNQSWFYGGIFAIVFFTVGLMLVNADRTAWGMYLVFLAFWPLAIHCVARWQYNPPKFSLFKGLSQSSKAES